MKLIDAEHLKRWLTARWLESDPTSDKPIKMVDILNQIDYGEFSIDLVRCGECKYSKDWYGDHRLCYLWAETGIGVFEDGYCSYGERRADDNSIKADK